MDDPPGGHLYHFSCMVPRSGKLSPRGALLLKVRSVTAFFPAKYLHSGTDLNLQTFASSLLVGSFSTFRYIFATGSLIGPHFELGICGRISNWSSL